MTPADRIGVEVSWGEACRLTDLLAVDTSTRLGAAVAGWNYPMDRLTLANLDLFDLQMMVAWAQGGGKGAKPKPYPRPWPEVSSGKTRPDANVTQEQIVAALRFAGHTAELPSS